MLVKYVECILIKLGCSKYILPKFWGFGGPLLETVQDRMSVGLFANRKLHTDFQLVSKLLTLMTLNGIMTADARYLCSS